MNDINATNRTHYTLETRLAMIEQELARLNASSSLPIIHHIVMNFENLPLATERHEPGYQLLAQLKTLEGSVSKRRLHDFITRLDCWSYRAFVVISDRGQFHYWNPFEIPYTHWEPERKKVVLQTEDAYPPRDIIFHTLEYLDGLRRS